MKILVVGGSGYLGAELVRQASAAGHQVVATHFTTASGASVPLDIRDRDQVFGLVAATSPELVVNAAYVQADWETTAVGPGHLAAATQASGARLVQVSSDVVFSGDQVTYDEGAVPDPISGYGAAKAAAETVVRLLAPDALIARTSLILGDGKSGQERFVRALARRETQGALFVDDVRCPVHLGDLAAALLELGTEGHRGLVHVAGPDAVNRHELATLIARREGLDANSFRTARRADSAVRGPLDVRLDSRATQARLRTRLRGVREFLAGPIV